MVEKKDFIIGVDTGGMVTGVFVPGDGCEAGTAIFRVVW